jgi:acyl-coenzyme A thioesterase PaaI-like protein
VSEPSPTSDDAAGPEDNVPPRIKLLDGLEATPRRAELRRLAAAGREMIEHLVSTTATEEQLTEMADQLEQVAGLLGSLPSGQSYLGYSEAANAGAALSAQQGDDAIGVAEFASFFDHSPFIGLANPISPPMYFQHHGDRIEGTVCFGSAYEGPPGCVHGGYVAAAFDELLGATQSLSGTQGMTARLEVNYRSPTPLRTELRMEGVLDRHEGRKIYCVGRLWAGERLCAEAEGLFISFDGEKFRELLEARQLQLEP